MNGEQIISFVKSNPISVACGVLVLALGGGIWYRSDKVPDGEATLNTKASLGERIDANIKNGVGLQDQYAALSAARQQIESRLMRPDAQAINLQFFYKLETETGTKLMDIRQNGVGGKGPKGKGGFYLPIAFSVTVRGDYIRILDVLRRLESGQRFCRINSANVTLSGGNDSNRGNELTLTMNMDVLGQQ